MSTPTAVKPARCYISRVFPYRIYSPDVAAPYLWSATLVYVEEDSGHPTGYEHPRYPRDDSDPVISQTVRQLLQLEIRGIAANSRAYLKRTGKPFELPHPDWWAPGIEDPPPLFVIDGRDELLAA